MHKRSWLILGMTVVIAIVAGSAIQPVTTIQADEFAQGSLPLSDYRIYFSEDNGEASRFNRSAAGLSRLGGLLNGLGAELYTLEWRDHIPNDADLVIIAGPLWSLQTDRIARLWLYLSNGGSMLLLADVTSDDEYTGIPSGSGVFELLWVDMGIRGNDDIVLREEDAQNDNSVEDGENPASSPNSSPLNRLAYFTTSTINPSHAITQGVDDELAFLMARSLQISGTSAPFQVSPLVYSGTGFYGETTLPANVEDTEYAFEYDQAEDIVTEEFPLAAAIEGIASETRIVIIGDREFATNGMGLQTVSSYSFDFVHPANAQFLLNTVTWLLDAEPVELSEATPDFSVSSDASINESD